MGFRLLATRGTAEFLGAHGVDAETVHRVNEGRPNVVDLIKSRQIDIVINTPLGRESFYDEGSIRKSATLYGVLCVTTLTGAAATVRAIEALREKSLDVASLQEIHAARAAGVAH
jgi:carbamoyl-phosphate synthase large subunit